MTLLYVLNFGMVGEQILVKKKDPPVCPEFWYGREENSGEKERPSCMSLILVWLEKNSGEKEIPSSMS